jgi:protein arginine kinase activator
MYCQECKQKPATVFLTQMFNGKKIEMHLCEECAAKKGGSLFDIDSQFSVSNLLGTLLGTNYNLQQAVTPSANVKQCPGCQMSLKNISQTGKLSCAECYTVFEKEIEPTLRRIHGNSRHIGKIPVRGGEKVLVKNKIAQLKSQLQKAVANEEYEKAAEIRDSIKDMQNQL